MAKHQISLEELDDKINKAKKNNKELSKHKSDPEDKSGGAAAARAGLEFFSGVLAGSMLGYFIDKWLGTAPIFIVICLLLGSAAGMLNIYRFMNDS